jgi:hypothetical protein
MRDVIGALDAVARVAGGALEVTPTTAERVQISTVVTAVLLVWIFGGHTPAPASP